MIKLNDEFYIDSDTYNWILVRKRIGDKGNAKGKIVYENYRFFSSLESLLTYVKEINYKALGSPNIDFNDYLIKISAENKKWLYDIRRLCEGIKKSDVKEIQNEKAK